ncbi:MAG: methionine--tRNA ligase [Chlamydiae bacterium]|nr:methionine--tRNA ligase [Chlamydiota bacterium]
MKQRILITSALPYANGPIHFGHIAGAYLPADCYARFERLLGKDVLYICGSDEYGIAITLSAELANRTPQAHVDFFHEVNNDLFKKLGISFDHYSRTTWHGHVEVVQAFFNDLNAAGYIEPKVENHLFSEEENRFLADRYVIGICPKCGYDKARGDECSKCAASYEATDLKNPKSKLTGSSLILKPSKHWYLRFDKFKDELTKWIEKKAWKENVVNFAKEYIKELKPRAITRDSAWGVPIPLKEAAGKVFYVWFDAPIGYISATKEWAELNKKPESWKNYWLDPKTKLVQFIGKDNIPFHTVFFPAMIMGQKQPYKLADEVPANEFLMLEGRQFSKSDGWYIDLSDFLQKYSADQIRYALASNAPENQDADFTWKDFQMRCNSELLGKLGNFVNRTLVFIKNNLEQKVPYKKHLEEIDKAFLLEISLSIDAAKEAYSHFKLRKASQVLIELAQKANIYFDYKKPWLLVKDHSKKDELNTTLSLCLDCIKALSLIAYPIIPKTALEMYEMLELKNFLEKKWDEIKNEVIVVGSKLAEPKILFRKIEDKEIEEEILKLKACKKEVNLPTSSFTELKNSIAFDDFEKIDLRVGQILKAENVANSKKLLKLEVDLGFEKRQIVSGIAHKIKADTLIGKKVIVVANLKPAKIMGIESQGMVLAAGNEELELPSIQNLPAGTIVS